MGMRGLMENSQPYQNALDNIGITGNNCGCLKNPFEYHIYELSNKDNHKSMQDFCPLKRLRILHKNNILKLRTRQEGILQENHLDVNSISNNSVLIIFGVIQF
ncbi:hypothetical protein BLOT_005862 [Blomia tropicalis]|nr:hypothetical protein BLOT_005862 [Blomia tropicalis]